MNKLYLIFVLKDSALSEIAGVPVTRPPQCSRLFLSNLYMNIHTKFSSVLWEYEDACDPGIMSVSPSHTEKEI